MTKTAVVSGTSMGIGEVISRKILGRDFKVYGISRTPSPITDPNFVWIQADLTKPGDIKSITEQIEEDAIDLLVNNAGIALHEDVLNFDDEVFQKTFAINFIAPIKLTQALYPKLSQGLVVNVSSLSDRYPDGIYGSSKAALNNYFESIAEDKNSPRIISMLPSYVDTPLLRNYYADDASFTWDDVSSPELTAEFIVHLLENPTHIESGSRVIVITSRQAGCSYDPEKLWLYITDEKKLTRLK